jgi:hypothetical protein
MPQSRWKMVWSYGYMNDERMGFKAGGMLIHELMRLLSTLDSKEAKALQMLPLSLASRYGLAAASRILWRSKDAEEISQDILFVYRLRDVSILHIAYRNSSHQKSFCPQTLMRSREGKQE